MIVTDHEMLRTVSTDVETYAEGQAIAEQLIAEIGKHKNAAGLSAIQIGIPKRVFICWDSYQKVWASVINPQIELAEGSQIQYEGCLSFAGISVKTKRAATMTVSMLEEDGERHKYALDGFDSVVFQHEYDHLDGKTMFERRAPIEELHSAKIGRNDPCPCGSNKKYKKCCGK
jgi:peptide deformylase